MAVSDIDFHQRVEILLKWLRDSGARFPKVEISRYAEEGRDLRAKSPINAGEEIIYIPRKCIIEVQQGKECKIGQAVKQEAKGWVSGHTYLAIRMLMERDLGPKSFFAPWFKVLPTDYKAQGMPQYWSDEQKAEIRHTKTLAKANAVVVAIEEMWDRISQVSAIKKTGWTLKDFAWARYTVLTRTFGVEIEKKEATVMVPLADMANHEFDRPSRWKYDDVSKGFVVKIVRDLDKGMNLTDTYGSKGNDSFLPFYGFCLENNEFNQGRFTLPVKHINGLHVPFLSRIAVSRCAYEPEDGKVKNIDATTDTEASGSKRGGKELFSYCRALVLDSDEMKRMVRRQSKMKRPTENPVSCVNEFRTLDLIKTTALRSLERFSTTVEEDETILRDTQRCKRFSWYRNAVLARLGEKRTLLFYVKLADTMIPFLSCKSYRAITSMKAYKRVREADRETEWGYHANKYLEKVVIPLVKAGK
eukprot:CAMPEP_0184503210 /NCGR_PEP_ID=MMETSP0113_2-20130426/51755_1 /TAXON_ID=91329 /ORGANISM="Norrisiella sphaerica, Strain BC52" /LENGTH=472 /DNA_ID=CAMNT_0026892661 /DNA_START=130 /DNA_END=1548 /DNA_ORIENTATION=-